MQLCDTALCVAATGLIRVRAAVSGEKGLSFWYGMLWLGLSCIDLPSPCTKFSAFVLLRVAKWIPKYPEGMSQCSREAHLSIAHLGFKQGAAA